MRPPEKSKKKLIQTSYEEKDYKLLDSKMLQAKSHKNVVLNRV